MTLSLFEDAPPPAPIPRNAEPWKQCGPVALYLGECLDVLRELPANCIDAVVTDPPYGIGFMGKEWDTFDPAGVAENERKAFRAHHGFNLDDPRRTNPNLKGRQRSPAMSPSQIEYDYSVAGLRGFQAWTAQWAAEALRVLKPGGHALVCGAPRSAHRMVCGLEDAGFEIRDSFAWLFGQGFPKSKNLRDEEGLKNGWGTALKPGHEPIAVARKPLRSDVDTTAKIWGVGALNIDGCRLPIDDDGYARNASGDRGHADNRTRNHDAFKMTAGSANAIGRWPANVLLDEQAGVLLDEQAGVRTSGANPTRRGSDKFRKVFGRFGGEESCQPARGAQRGGASRFFFVAKPSRIERDFGCESLPMRSAGECTERQDGSAGLTPYAGAGRSGGGRNFHPTVKPVSLMRWLVRLVTPPVGIVLDPFMGSGTTGMATVLEGFNFIGIERDADYIKVADARLDAVLREVRALAGRQ